MLLPGEVAEMPEPGNHRGGASTGVNRGNAEIRPPLMFLFAFALMQRAAESTMATCREARFAAEPDPIDEASPTVCGSLHSSLWRKTERRP